VSRSRQGGQSGRSGRSGQAGRSGRSGQAGRRRRLAGAALAGLAIAAGLPPWGWWPLTIVGLGWWFARLEGLSARRRWLHSAVVGLFWMAPATLWMLDFTPLGWPIAVAAFASLIGCAGLLTPSEGPWRRVCFPAALVLVELIRWNWPFGGVPIATLAMAGVSAPFAVSARLAGPGLLVAVIAAAGVGLSDLRRNPKLAAAAVVVSAAATLGGQLAGLPSETLGEIEAAVVQGGGPQNTRADLCENRGVFERHMEATATIDRPVDLVIWPEDVVHPAPDGSVAPARCSDPLLTAAEARTDMETVAARNDAVVVSGWFEPTADRSANRNYVTALSPEGEISGRYDKVRLVPFGEFVPLRSLVERFSGELPARDVLAGSGPAVIDTPLGSLGVAISWEIFFHYRARDAIGNGGEVLLNPTNGSSYWLTIVQAQQIASSRLRAIETDRWVLQAAPTGFSAVVSADGEVLQRSGVSEQRVLYAAVELRSGRTPAVVLGAWPMLAGSLAALAWCWACHARLRRR